MPGSPFSFQKLSEAPDLAGKRCWEWGRRNGEQQQGRTGAGEESISVGSLVIRRFELRKKLISNETSD